MANYLAVYSVGSSLITYLQNAYTAARTADTSMPACSFALLSSGELQKENPSTATLSLYLYRVTMNEYLRNAPRDPTTGAPPPLALDLHYLLNVWSDQAVVEHAVLGWAMRELYQHETLSPSDLTADGGWEPADLIQVIPAELSTEDLMRVWDAITLPYRLSVSYIARVVRIDVDGPAVPPRPVVVRRFDVGDLR